MDRMYINVRYVTNNPNANERNLYDYAEDIESKYYDEIIFVDTNADEIEFKLPLEDIVYCADVRLYDNTVHIIVGDVCLPSYYDQDGYKLVCAEDEASLRYKIKKQLHLMMLRHANLPTEGLE